MKKVVIKLREISKLSHEMRVYCVRIFTSKMAHGSRQSKIAQYRVNFNLFPLNKKNQAAYSRYIYAYRPSSGKKSDCNRN